MLRLLVMLAVVALAGAGWGAKQACAGLRDRTQVVMSCADFVKKPQKPGWVKLTDCEYDFAGLLYEQRQGERAYSAVYVPLYPVGARGRTHILVSRTSSEILEVAYMLEHGLRNPPGLGHVMSELAKPTEGTVELGAQMSASERAKFNALDVELTDDFVVIRQGRSPLLLAGLLAMGAGLAAAAVLVALSIRELRKSKTRQDSPHDILAHRQL